MGFTLESEPVAVERRLQPRRFTDEKECVVDEMFLAKFGEEHLGQLLCSRRKQPDVEQAVRVGVNRSVHPVSLGAELDHGLVDGETSTITVRHPAETIGDLVTIELDAPDSSRMRIDCSPEQYADRRTDVDRKHGGPAVDELPSPQKYVNTFLAGGLIEPANAIRSRRFSSATVRPT